MVAAGTATLTITATENISPDERNATIILKAGAASKTFTVIQKQKDALAVTSSKIEVTADGDEISIEVKANISFDYEIEEVAKPVDYLRHYSWTFYHYVEISHSGE